MRVVVLFNDERALAHGSAAERAAVESVVTCAKAVAEAAVARGHVARLQAAVRDPGELVRSLANCDVVFNLVESVDGEARLEAAVAWQLELAKVAYTGCPPLSMSLCLNKPIGKAVLSAQGVRVAQGRVVAGPDDALPTEVPFPWIVKPTREDASHGISTASVVHSLEAARAQVDYVTRTYAQPALVEAFLPGRELNISVLGEGAAATTLSPAEIDFGGLPSGHPPLITYEAKWDEDSEVCKGTPSVAAELMPELRTRVEATALAAYRTLGLRDYGRVDMRLAQDGTPVVLEVNPNPDISPDAGLAKAAARSGVSYADLIDRILQNAWSRRVATPPTI